MSAAAADRLPGPAAQALAELGHELTLHDLYDEVGAPVYHDLAATDTSEIRELLSLVRRTPGQVLELAAGSGRLTLPLLALGRDVTALERSDHMLRLLRGQLAQAPDRLSRRCTVVQGDMTAFALHRAYAVIVLGTTSISLLDEAGRDRLYRAVRAHLAPGGRFLLSNVDLPSDDVEAGEDADSREVEAIGASGRRYRMFEYCPAGSLSRHVTIVPEARGAGPVTVCTTRISVLPIDLLERELAAAGLRIRSRVALPATGLPHRDLLLELEGS